MEYDINKMRSAIRESRIKMGLTQQQLGEAVNISTNHVRNIEHGRKQASLSILFAIFQKLNMRMDMFLYPQTCPDQQRLISDICTDLSRCSIDELKTLRHAIKGIITKCL